jgi:hypothetical protein
MTLSIMSASELDGLVGGWAQISRFSAGAWWRVRARAAVRVTPD